MFSRFFRRIRGLLNIAGGAESLIAADPFTRQIRILAAYYRDWMLCTHPRYADPRTLTRYGYSVYSQTDEDGILAEILKRLGIESGTFVEIGVEDGSETCTTALLQAGWSGVWLEGSPAHCSRIRELFAAQISAGHLTLREAFVTSESLNKLLAECRVPPAPDVLIIDTDGNDYWLWKTINYTPRVVVIEYKGDFGPSLEWVKPYDPAHRFVGTRYYGASLKSYELLGRELGYRLVGCNWHGTNAFFVRDNEPVDLFLAPFTSESHYEPPRHQWRAGSAWPKDAREFQSCLPAPPSS